MIRIESDHKDYVQKMNTEGTLLIDEQGFKIVAQEAELDVEGEKEYNCWFYLENNTDKGTWFQIEKMSVNGFVIKTSTMPRDYVPANTKGYKSILFTEDDIEKYGLFTYEDFQDLVSYEIYCSFPTQYFKVAIGKGILTWEDLYYYIERYAPLM